jgi:hypothetical protein
MILYAEKKFGRFTAKLPNVGLVVTQVAAIPPAAVKLLFKTPAAGFTFPAHSTLQGVCACGKKELHKKDSMTNGRFNK